MSFAATRSSWSELVQYHECAFTRGYETGFVVAMIETRTGFCGDFLASQVEPLMEVLGETDARVTVGDPERLLYGVAWVRICVSFPEGD